MECVSILNENLVVPDEIVSFSQSVLTKAKEFLIELAKIEGYSSIMETNHEEFKKIKENNYFWKDNYENNEKTFRK